MNQPLDGARCAPDEVHFLRMREEVSVRWRTLKVVCVTEQTCERTDPYIGPWPGEPDLLSFAAITDEPPSEVAAAGHDRCIVSISELHAIFDDRDQPYYEHRMAAWAAMVSELQPL